EVEEIEEDEEVEEEEEDEEDEEVEEEEENVLLKIRDPDIQYDLESTHSTSNNTSCVGTSEAALQSDLSVSEVAQTDSDAHIEDAPSSKDDSITTELTLLLFDPKTSSKSETLKLITESDFEKPFYDHRINRDG